ncbi:glutamate--cysteine ligase [Brachybacterium vulturis]|uniref:Glutamate--cysteine ligase n=1 Tax=Brachybacterium vulturis TaxID=2017484 RepID=A0A291GLI0_9MICO|nr:ExeM/NucH family extracellular endonuclease [Brachybacterium vulturis]ATG50930.1 glutamate--cysteine ligase [Brachybacterium vulturis]
MSTPTHGVALRSRMARVGAAAAALALGVSLVPGLSATAQAAVVTPGDLQLNEIYGGGGNSGAAFQHDFVELVNTGDEDISVDGWSLQYASKSGTFNNSVALSGTVPAGSTFLIRLAPGNGAGDPLPESDLTGGINASGSGGTFALSDAEGALACEGTTCAEDPAVVDLVGWGPAATFSGEAPAPGTDNATSVSRIAATGENSTDFAAGTPTPGDAAPGDGGDDGGGDEQPPGETVEASIADIQGTGAQSPLAGQHVVTEGVVTAVYATGGLNGYVIQTAGSGGALDLSTHTGSTAVFVYSVGTMDQVAVGDSVRVTGEVSEYHGSTQITVGAEGLQLLEQDLEPVEPATLAGTFPVEEAQRESLEHMLYLPGEGDFTVTDVYPTNRFGEVTLAIGDEPLWQAGELMAPGAEATEYFTSRDELTVLLDDGKTTNFSDNAQQPLSWLSTEEPVRVGAAAGFTDPVVVAYSFDQWRLNPTTPWTSADTDGVDFEATRQDAPDAVGGDLQLATFNVLNYFTTLGEDTPGCEPYTNIEGEGTSVAGGCLLRGAWGADDLERQESKIVDAIVGTGADVVGLMEIENSARLGEEADEATATLVAALNAQAGEGTWDYVRTGEAYSALGLDGGQDVITNAIIFKPAEVTPVGSAEILAEDEAFENAREPIGQVFAPVSGSGAEQVEGEPFLFTVNHFKSKGSKDDEDADLPEDPVQGNARTSRLQQAEALLTWGEATAAERGVEDVFHGGDFNAYTEEEPLQLFYDAGFENLRETHDPESWTYSYGGMVGALDHVVANASAAERISGATAWQINGPESVMLQYSRYLNNTTDLYGAGPFASSDHDPVIVGLDAEFAEAEDFVDVPPGTMFYDEIMWMADNGYSTGWEDGTFRPLEPVNRDAMAAFLYRLAGSPEVDLPRSEPFTDVEKGDEHYAAIMWAYQQGITEGWDDGTFRPTTPIARDAMAAFVYRYAGSPDVEDPTSAVFDDVSASNQFATEIAWMRSEEITTGWPDGTYRPLAPTNRDATAAFLYRMSAENEISYLSEQD